LLMLKIQQKEKESPDKSKQMVHKTYIKPN
jgi:hypothetical protein